MTTLFASGSNQSPAREIFNEKIKYDTEIFPDTLIPNFIDTWDEDRFYGIINTKGNACYPDESQLKPLVNSNADETLYALGFVADAWRDFSDKLQQLAGENIIFRNSPWANLKATKGWQSVDLSYDRYMIDTLYPIFTEQYLNINAEYRQLKNPGSYLQVFYNFASRYFQNAGPITLSGFIESNYVSIMHTGLAIETANAAYDNDFVKTYTYYDDNFTLVASIAENYGFYIDKNVPWRFVANLQSPAMQEYMRGLDTFEVDVDNRNNEKCEPVITDPSLIIDAYAYSEVPGMRDVLRRLNVYFDPGNVLKTGYRPLQEIRTRPQDVFDLTFSSIYTETWSVDIDYVLAYIISFYNFYVNAFPIISEKPDYNFELGCVTRTSVFQRETITQEQFDSFYDERWNVKSFFVLRLLERQKDILPSLRTAKFQEAMNIYYLSGQNYLETLRYIQEKCIGPLGTSPFTISTIGGTLTQDTPQQRDTNDFISDTRRQVGVRRSLY